MALREVLNNKKGKASRYFRINEASNDYATIPPVSLSGDFSGSVEFSTTTTTQSSMLSGSASGVSSVVLDITISGSVRLFAFNSLGALQGIAIAVGVFNDGVVRIASFSLVGTTATISVDGGTPATVQWLTMDGLDIRHLYRTADGTRKFFGILANLKIYDNSALVRDYPIDDGLSDLREKVSGQNGSVINGEADRWGLFRELPTLWKGQNLTVPPWVSTDQELLKA